MSCELEFPVPTLGPRPSHPGVRGKSEAAPSKGPFFEEAYVPWKSAITPPPNPPHCPVASVIHGSKATEPADAVSRSSIAMKLFAFLPLPTDC